MYFTVKDKIVLITGSSHGLGLTFARGLGMEGATIILNGRNHERLDGAEKKLRKDGITVFTYPFDVTNRSEIEVSVSKIEKEVGPIDVLVNNAGIQRRGPLEEIDEVTWQEVLNTNLTGVFLTSQLVVRGMIERQRGKIINICSLMCEHSRPTTGPYTASKGGVKMLTKAMAMEWAKYNIQVNGIGPGYFITEMNQPLADDPNFDAWIRKRTPAGRWGDPTELVGPMIFFASDASAFVTGQILYVDGGILTSL